MLFKPSPLVGVSRDRQFHEIARLQIHELARPQTERHAASLLDQ
jgi:hypothetical protein